MWVFKISRGTCYRMKHTLYYWNTIRILGPSTERKLFRVRYMWAHSVSWPLICNGIPPQACKTHILLDTKWLSSNSLSYYCLGNGKWNWTNRYCGIDVSMFPPNKQWVFSKTWCKKWIFPLKWWSLCVCVCVQESVEGDWKDRSGDVKFMLILKEN